MDEPKMIRKPRYDGRSKKRKWEERRSDKGEALGIMNESKKNKEETPVTSELIERIKRRKFVILLGYSGVDYLGMQRNPGTKTIEEEFFLSLLKNEYINQESYQQVQMIQFQRAARTDKGVSAARQIVSIKLPENVEIEKLNEHLPETIKVFGLKRVTKGFNSKSQCDSRSYMYMLPTVAFIPKDQIMEQKGFRLDPTVLVKVDEVLRKFLGTKNFHNFTSKKKCTDPSAKRYMKMLSCDPPFVRKDVEFTIIRVQGQSFMLHQIRKMVGLTLAIIKGLTDVTTMDLAFSNEKVNIPRAPGLGLVLEYVHYDRYNLRYGEDGVHDKLLWDEVEGDVQQFKEEHIYPTIINKEVEEEAMVQWVIKKLSGHKFDDVDNDEDDEKSDNENKVVVSGT